MENIGVCGRKRKTFKRCSRKYFYWQYWFLQGGGGGGGPFKRWVICRRRGFEALKILFFSSALNWRRKKKGNMENMVSINGVHSRSYCGQQQRYGGGGEGDGRGVGFCCWYLSRDVKAKLVSAAVTYLCVCPAIWFPSTKSPMKGFSWLASSERWCVTTLTMSIMRNPSGELLPLGPF